MTNKILYIFAKWVMSIYLPYLIILTLIVVHFMYYVAGKWIFTHVNENHIDSIISLMSVAATTFAAITAAILVSSWKKQQNLSNSSKIINNIWDLHHKLGSEINNLTYTYNDASDIEDILQSNKNIIAYSYELRTFTKHAMILLNSQYDLTSLKILEKYFYYLESFYPWFEFDNQEYKDYSYEVVEEFKEINLVLDPLFKSYLYLE